MTEKTNAIRLCEGCEIVYKTYTYDADDGAIDGCAVADKIGKAYDEIFKTLVTVGHSKANYVFVIPVSGELDLKKAAKAVGEKSVEMIPVKEILKTTGYVKGGCSPIGMKKYYHTVFDETLILLDEVTFNAGKIGLQICMPVAEIQKVLPYQVADVLK